MNHASCALAEGAGHLLKNELVALESLGRDGDTEVVIEHSGVKHPFKRQQDAKLHGNLDLFLGSFISP